MKKFLFFKNSETDALTLPADNLIGMEVNTTSAAIALTFQDFKDGDGNTTLVTIGTTTDKANEALEAIANEIRSGKNPFIVVADEISGDFLHPVIDAVDNSLSV
tara:strand:+ start:328 stop:639 length:312 start_codon:yes stop_codon:yes gene_type:complete